MKKKTRCETVQGFRAIRTRSYTLKAENTGAIVTYAKGGESLHNYGVSADFCIRKGGYNASSQLWANFGRGGKDKDLSGEGSGSRLLISHTFK